MKLGPLSNPLDRHDVSAFAGQPQHETGKHRLPIEQYGAGAAFPELTAVLRSGQPQIFAQDLQKRLVRCKRDLGALAVDDQADVRLLG